MPAGKERELVEQITKKTKQGLIVWEPTAHSDQFLTTFKGEASFTIRKYDDQYGSPQYVLSVSDQFGRELLTDDSSDPGGVLVQRPGELGTGKEHVLRELYEAAHHSALKYDETIDLLLDELRKAG